MSDDRQTINWVCSISGWMIYGVSLKKISMDIVVKDEVVAVVAAEVFDSRKDDSKLCMRVDVEMKVGPVIFAQNWHTIEKKDYSDEEWLEIVELAFVCAENIIFEDKMRMINKLVDNTTIEA